MEQALVSMQSQEERLEKEIQSLREQCDRVRKSQFAKIGALTKLYNDLSYQLEILNKNICKKEVTLC